MAGQFLTDDERVVLVGISEMEGVDGRRAAALLGMDGGKSQSEAAEAAGLTVGQVKYAWRKFKAQRLAAFADVGVGETAVSSSSSDPAVSEQTKRLEGLVSELDDLVAELKATVPAEGVSPYSPLTLLTTIRENLHNLAPDVQFGILESFEGMTLEDVKDIDTWKGMAYMLSYSAQFQAGLVKEKLNEKLPDPLKPDTVLGFMKKSIDRFTPELAKDMYNNFQGTSKEDWLDPDTWKGMWYMINYSMQFQAEQLKQRLTGVPAEEEG